MGMYPCVFAAATVTANIEDLEEAKNILEAEGFWVLSYSDEMLGIEVPENTLVVITQVLSGWESTSQASFLKSIEAFEDKLDDSPNIIGYTYPVLIASYW